MSEPETFYHMPSVIIVLRSFDTQKHTIKNSLTKKVFSFANSVDASQSTCIVSLDINTMDRHILAKKMQKKNVMKKHKLKPPTFTLIMLSSMQPFKIPQKLTEFLIILVESSIYLDGRATMTINGVLNQ